VFFYQILEELPFCYNESLLFVIIKTTRLLESSSSAGQEGAGIYIGSWGGVVKMFSLDKKTTVFILVDTVVFSRWGVVWLGLLTFLDTMNI